MKMAIKRIAEKSNRKLSQVLDGVKVNLMLPIAEVMMATQWHIEQLAGAAGLKIIAHIIADDVRRLAGEQRYGRDDSEGRLWGHQAGWGRVCRTKGRRRETTSPEQTDRPGAETAPL